MSWWFLSATQCRRRRQNKQNNKVEPITSLTCPCCKKKRDAAKETPLFQTESTLIQKNADPWKRKPGWSVEGAAKNKLRWACQFCLDAGRALAAQPWEQQFCDHQPYFAYYDAPEVCEDCGQPFVFGAKEQQFWYEERRFWVQSWPKHCVDCRRKRREQKKEQRQRMEAAEAAAKARPKTG